MKKVLSITVLAIMFAMSSCSTSEVKEEVPAVDSTCVLVDTTCVAADTTLVTDSIK